MTPQDALATAVEEWWPDMEADTYVTLDYAECSHHILAALPEGTALVTPDSLAAALQHEFGYVTPPVGVAKAIIEYAKGAERG